MYFFDDKQHHVPHVHAACSGDEAVFAIPTGEVLAGKLSSGKTRLVQAWIEIHRDELLAAWQLAVTGEEVCVLPVSVYSSIFPGRSVATEATETERRICGVGAG